jgi:hypothetical protein
VLLTVGSDLASPWVIPGVSFHQELELLTDAGLSPSEALGMATRNGAQALGLLADVGTYSEVNVQIWWYSREIPCKTFGTRGEYILSCWAG